MTPSLPTFSMASAIRLPIVLSLFDAIVATWAISFLSLVALDMCFSSSTTASTACSIPRFRPIGFAPAVTFLSPARKRSEEHTSELQSRSDLVCRLLLEKKKKVPDVDLEYNHAHRR